MNPIRINEDSLSDITIVANTPSYLFRRFRKDSSVQLLSERLSEFQLLEAALQYGSRPERSYLDKVYVYAYLVALSFKKASGIREAMRQLPLPQIEWTKELLRFSISETYSETRLSIPFVMAPVKLESLKSSPSTTSGVVLRAAPPKAIKPQRIDSAQNTTAKVVHFD